jgi:hypothetical protein
LKGKFGLDSAYQIVPFTNVILRKEVPWSSAKNLLANMQTDRVYKRQTQIDLSVGYSTNDDFGRDGDNPQHIPLPFASLPRYVQSNSSLPADISDETIVDVYAASFFTNAASAYLQNNLTDWIPAEENFTTLDILPRMARRYWSKDC